eukprot:CAMPEP_0170503272 /NCGR_PEP_ID=MMETSP0208-20121228/44192_1 /TAXON_ID=197538 /ORGANISM="Strombidium inclinatum, Strain S3" /LENGTH=228 /DNA_ID=CAMNT_0010782837 /DNA_START=374 /DNA_END=1057 /DNA_ORIENTATION=+
MRKVLVDYEGLAGGGSFIGFEDRLRSLLAVRCLLLMFVNSQGHSQLALLLDLVASFLNISEEASVILVNDLPAATDGREDRPDGSGPGRALIIRPEAFLELFAVFEVGVNCVELAAAADFNVRVSACAVGSVEDGLRFHHGIGFRFCVGRFSLNSPNFGPLFELLHLGKTTIVPVNVRVPASTVSIVVNHVAALVHSELGLAHGLLAFVEALESGAGLVNSSGHALQE